MMRIAIVAGEASGDLLGAALIDALNARHPEIEFIGIGGPKMIERGFQSLFPLERLSVMGISEVFGRLPELLSIRSQLLKQFTAHPPDLFLGIDAPDFNLTLERKLRGRGVKTAHYVSPSVWAWRQGRVTKIARSVDLMLTLFPFEKQFYEQHEVPVRFVGHPMADQIDFDIDQGEARARLGIDGEQVLIAILPGSRMSEVERLTTLFAETAAWCRDRRSGVHFIAPLATEKTQHYFEQRWREVAPDIEVKIVERDAATVVAAADAVLLASGTATLETMLINRPMVVAYRLARLTNWLLYGLGMLKSRYVSLPNLLADRYLVEEYIQESATPENLGAALLRLLDDEGGRREEQRERFDQIHHQLRLGASESAADALLELIQG